MNLKHLDSTWKKWRRSICFSELQHFFLKKNLSLSLSSLTRHPQPDRLLHAVCKRSSSEAAWERITGQSRGDQPSKWQKETRRNTMEIGEMIQSDSCFSDWLNPTNWYTGIYGIHVKNNASLSFRSDCLSERWSMTDDSKKCSNTCASWKASRGFSSLESINTLIFSEHEQMNRSVDT